MYVYRRGHEERKDGWLKNTDDGFSAGERISLKVKLNDGIYVFSFRDYISKKVESKSS